MRPPEESIISGGLEYPAVWVRCRATASFKPHETLVHINAKGVTDPLPFFIDSDLVSPSELTPGTEVDGQVKVLFLDESDGHIIIEVPGEPISYGPKILIGEDLVVRD